MHPLLAEVDWNSLLRDEEVIATVIVFLGIVGLIVLAAIIAPQWRKAHQTKVETLLKEQMIERGFTAEEITGVLNAGLTRDRLNPRGRGVSYAGNHA